VISGSVPRKRAHAACEDAATALDPPPPHYLRCHELHHPTADRVLISDANGLEAYGVDEKSGGRTIGGVTVGSGGGALLSVV